MPYTACQIITERGHRECTDSDNKGNFLELLVVVSRYDIVKKKRSGCGNAKHTHHDTQNEFFAIIASIITKDISKEIQKAEHFALTVDETDKDISKKEQL